MTVASEYVDEACNSHYVRLQLTVWLAGRTYTIKDYEKLADDFQRRRFGLAGCLPARMVEVHTSTVLACCFQFGKIQTYDLSMQSMVSLMASDCRQTTGGKCLAMIIPS